MAKRAMPAMLVRIKTYPDVFDRCFRAGLDRRYELEGSSDVRESSPNVSIDT